MSKKQHAYVWYNGICIAQTLYNENKNELFSEKIMCIQSNHIALWGCVCNRNTLHKTMTEMERFEISREKTRNEWKSIKISKTSGIDVHLQRFQYAFQHYLRRQHNHLQSKERKKEQRSVIKTSLNDAEKIYTCKIHIPYKVVHCSRSC